MGYIKKISKIPSTSAKKKKTSARAMSLDIDNLLDLVRIVTERTLGESNPAHRRHGKHLDFFRAFSGSFCAFRDSNQTKYHL
jgi:hypothetical protein